MSDLELQDIYSHSINFDDFSTSYTIRYINKLERTHSFVFCYFIMIEKYCIVTIK